jgi:hypothetical protein
MADELKGPGWIAKLRIALDARKALQMNWTKEALVKALLAGAAALSAAYMLAYQDQLVTRQELINLGWSFLSVFLATLVHTEK